MLDIRIRDMAQLLVTVNPRKGVTGTLEQLVGDRKKSRRLEARVGDGYMDIEVEGVSEVFTSSVSEGSDQEDSTICNWMGISCDHLGI